MQSTRAIDDEVYSAQHAELLRLAAEAPNTDRIFVNRWIKEHAPKGISSQTQGDQIRVTSKKRDDLQAVIAALKEQDFGIPLQFENFRD